MVVSVLHAAGEAHGTPAHSKGSVVRSSSVKEMDQAPRGGMWRDSEVGEVDIGREVGADLADVIALFNDISMWRLGQSLPEFKHQEKHRESVHFEIQHRTPAK